MITIRNFTRNDINDLKKNKYPNMPAADIINMIDLWNLKKYKGNYFEMFAIISDYEIVGYISLLQCDKIDTVSIGIEIFQPFRQQGYGTEAERICLAYAKKCDYKIARAQILVDNKGSISLHKKLGFVQKSITINNKGNEVYLLEKVL